MYSHCTCRHTSAVIIFFWTSKESQCLKAETTRSFASIVIKVESSAFVSCFVNS